jgi:hypothetical protein
MPEVADAVTWLPAANDAVRSLEAQPQGDQVRVALHLVGSSDALARDVVEEVVRPAVEKLWRAVPPRAHEMARATRTAQEGLAELEAQTRKARVAADLKLDVGQPADVEVGRVAELERQVQTRRLVVKELRARAETALAQARRDLKSIVNNVARPDLLRQAAEAADEAWRELGAVIAAPLEKLLQARTIFQTVVGDGANLEDRMADLLPELPAAPPQPMPAAQVPPELATRSGYLDPRTGQFVSGDLPRPVYQPEQPADAGQVARVAASLNHSSREGWEDSQGRWHEGPPPAAGETAMPPVPSYENTTLPKPGAGPANDVAKHEAEEADRLAELLLDQVLPQEQALPQAAPLPEAPRLPGEDEEPPRRRTRR